MYYLAIRQLLSRKKQTLLILLGISFGTMIYVLIAGVQLGFREYIQDELLNNTGHIIISGKENYIEESELSPRFFDAKMIDWYSPPIGKRDESRLENYQGWKHRLENHAEVLAYSPKLSLQAFAQMRDAKNSIVVNGVLPLKHSKVTQVDNYMKEGKLSDLSGGGNKVILGSRVFKNLGVKIGDNVMLSSGNDQSIPFKIVGKIKFGNPEVDKVIAFAHLKDTQLLAKTPGRVTEVLVSLYDIEKSQSLANKWDLYTNDKVESWQEANASFMSMIAIQDIVRVIITLSILLVAGFGIYNVLSIMISQKQKEIAILRSIGYESRKILELFLIQGLLLGVSGGILGLISGFILNLYFGSIDLGIEIGQGSNLLISYAPSIYIVAFVAALIASFIASYLPAKKATELTPIEIIRSS